MKPILLVAVVAGSFAMWAGFISWQSGAVTTTVFAGLTVLIGGSLLTCSWLWWNDKLASGDGTVIPTLILLLCGGTLIGILPRLFSLSSDGSNLVGSVATAILIATAAIVQSRKRRKLRDKSEPV